MVLYILVKLEKKKGRLMTKLKVAFSVVGILAILAWIICGVLLISSAFHTSAQVVVEDAGQKLYGVKPLH